MEVMILLLDTMAMALVCLWLYQTEQTDRRRKLGGALARVLVLFSFRTGPDDKELAKLEKRRRQSRGYRPPPGSEPPPMPARPVPARPVPARPTARRRD